MRVTIAPMNPEQKVLAEFNPVTVARTDDILAFQFSSTEEMLPTIRILTEQSKQFHIKNKTLIVFAGDTTPTALRFTIHH